MYSRLAAVACGLAVAAAQDPAQGWLAYASVKAPAGATRVTSIDARWRVGAKPRNSNSFYSPWFGMDTTDNLNLLQPVNPWFGQGSWAAYNEYYQWVPSHNENSQQFDVSPGDVLHGSIVYVDATDSYDVTQHDETNGRQVTMNIPVQKERNGIAKNYTIPYFVYEKVAPCGDYPPDGIVTFYDIHIQFDNKDVPVTWSTGIVDDTCNMRAKVINPSATNGTVTITWNTAAEDPSPELIARDQNSRTGWASMVPARKE